MLWNYTLLVELYRGDLITRTSCEPFQANFCQFWLRKVILFWPHLFIFSTDGLKDVKMVCDSLMWSKKGYERRGIAIK